MGLVEVECAQDRESPLKHHLRDQPSASVILLAPPSLLRKASFVILLSTSSSVPSVLCPMLRLGLMSGKVER